MSKIIDKIRKLLAKAEGTANEHEAAAFMAKAQEMMLQHAIDEAELERSGQHEKTKPTVRTLVIKKHTPGVRWRRALLNSLARNNRCRMWYISGTPYNYLAGFEDDVAFVELLYHSISLQMDSALAAAKQEKPPWVHGRSFVTSFMAGFVNRISDRLQEANKKEEDKLSSSLSLVLRDRKAEVDDFVNETAGRLTRDSSRPGYIDGHTYTAGQSAASVADISGGRGRVAAGRREIER